MLWPFLSILALASALGVHLVWRGRLRRFEEHAQREIAKLKQTQESAALKIQTQQEALFNSMAEGVLVLDQAGRIQLANHAFMELFGVTTDVGSRTVMEALRIHELTELIDSLATKKQVLGYELKLPRPNERWLQVNGAALMHASGEYHGTVLVFHELTRLKRLERARQEFVANVSHELRTPLSLIKGYVETLLTGAKDNPEVATRFLQTIDRNAERLRLLIEDLLTISELESGRVKLNLQTVALQSFIGKLLADFQARADTRRVQLLNETPELRVRADPDRLEQVLANLVDNAIKYGRAEGCVRVSARAVPGELVEVDVADDGPGIPTESLERVFERFYRVDKARSREQGGTGLGLSIVKHIVQSHGGRTWAQSQPGQGATFCFTLPRDGGEVQQPLL